MTTDNARRQHGFLTVTELAARYDENNLVLDPGSLLISGNATLGKNNTFYPNVVIDCQDGSTVIIGDDNIFYPGTYILSANGKITIGNNNEFGTGGCTIKANMPGAIITVGSRGRYCDGVSVMGATTLGDGSQILGAITVQSCTLASGEDYTEADPDKRASVLKGFGLARNISLKQGQVVNGQGNFANAPIEWQRAYHPTPKK